MKKFFSLFMILCLMLACCNFTAFSVYTKRIEGEENGWLWYYNNSYEYYCIYGYIGTETTATIPTELNGHKIICIDISTDDYDLGTIKKLTVPKGITELWCIGGSNLQTVTFARDYDEGIINIEDGCFWDCTKLKKVVLPNLLKDDCINYSVFHNCKKLTTVVMPEYLRAIGSGAFEKCTSLKSIVIPEGTEKVGDQAFAHCGFDYIKLPSSLNKLQSFVFGSDYNLENRIFIDVPKGSWAENEVYEQIAEFEDWNIDVLYKIVDTENPLEGDINGDFDIDINDVTYMQLDLAMYDISPSSSTKELINSYGVYYENSLDINGDGVYNIKDGTYIQLKLLKGEEF